MPLDLVPLFVNEIPSINSDSFKIVYDPAEEVVYQIGQPASSISGDILFTKQNAATGALILSELFADTMPVSGNSTFNAGALGLNQIVVNPSGGFVYGVTESAAASNRGISRWDGATLIEDAHINPAVAIGTTHETLLGSFLLDGVEYVAMAYPSRFMIINAQTMASVFDGSHSVTGQLYYLLIGEQPTSTTQALYTITQSGTRLRLYRHIFTGSTISSSTLIFNWLTTNVDPLWPSGFNSNPQPYLPMFDRSDNTIIFIVGSFEGAGASDTAAYLMKVNPTTGAIIWKFGVPNTYQWSNTSSPSILTTGTLRFLPGDDNGFDYPWTGSTPTMGVVLNVNTADGTYTEELYPELGDLGNANANRGHIYYDIHDLLFVYDSNGVNGYGNGWLAFAQAAEPPVDATIGGSGCQLEPIGCILKAQPYALEVRDLNSVLELGPFRFIEQKDSDETSMVTTLVIGLTEVDTGLLVEVDMALISGNVDMATLVDVLGDDIYIDMGEGIDNSDDFTLELLGNDDGSTYPGPPIEFKPETLSPIEDRGSIKQYSPEGKSFIYHRVRLKATEVGQKYAVKFVDLSGQLTGRLF